MVKERGVIDIEHDFADERERVSAVSITKDAHIARDQAAKWIEREMAYRRFNTAAVQFLHNPRAPLVAEAFSRQIPPAADRSRDNENNRDAQNGNRELTREGRLSILRVLNRLCFLNNSWHQ
jgi:hypothetical protein